MEALDSLGVMRHANFEGKGPYFGRTGKCP